MACLILAAACSNDVRMSKARPDGGRIVDAALPAVDAGVRVRDAGPRDAGARDAARDATISFDAGTDAGAIDAGGPVDAGSACPPLPTTGTITISGALTASSGTWSRPYDGATSCPTSIDPGRTCHVETFVLCDASDAPSSYRIRMEGRDTASVTLADPFLVVYSGEGIPSTAGSCTAVNDDESSSSWSSEVTVSLSAGETITIAATSYNEAGTSAGTGTFELRITRL